MMKKHSFWHRIKRSVMFFLGDIRRMSHFPWVTWDVHYKNVDYAEAIQGLKLIKKGDVGIHRDDGYLSNLAIPGFCKHAWIHVDDGGPDAEIVEAVSEGVLRRHALHPMISDYVMILRPPSVTTDDVDLAVGYARQLEGCSYDVDFNFDMERAHGALEDINSMKFKLLHKEKVCHLTSEDTSFVSETTGNLKIGFGSFSCTEVVAFSWWHKRRELNIKRKIYASKEIIAADDFLDGFDIIWVSRHVTPEAAKKMGLSGILVEKVRKHKCISHPS